MEILTSRIVLHPTDLVRTQHFYEHQLQLAIYREWQAGPHRSIVFFLGGGGLLEVGGMSSEPPSQATALVLQVRDLLATREFLQERGIEIESEPERKPWGLLELTVRDPDGLSLIFVEVPADHPRRRG